MTDHQLVIRVTIPGEPVPKQRPVTINRGGRVWTFTPRETVIGEREIARAVALGRRALDDADASFAVVVRFYSRRPHERKWTCDLDNYVKAVLDALTPARKKGTRFRGPGLIWRDDRQVTQIRATRYDRQDRPRTELEVYRVLAPAVGACCLDS